MTFVTLNPNGTVSNTGAVTGSSAHAALSDSSDATYVFFTEGQGAKLNLTDLSLPSGAVILNATLFVRASSTGDLAAALIADSTKFGSSTFDPYSYVEIAVLGIISGLTDAGLDGATLVLSQATPHWTTVSKAWVRVMYLAKPTLLVTAPSGSITINRPTVEWTAAYDIHASGVPYRQVKIFNSTQYGAGGFNPDTSTPVWDSGVVQTTSEEVQVGATLPDATYRAYVKVASGVTPDQWSSWMYSSFTTNTPVPGTPTLTATGDNVNARITLSVDDTAGSDSITTTKFQVQRRDGVSAAWENFRTEDGDGMVDTSGSAVTLYDYETSSGDTWSYRARAFGTDTWSDWSTTDTAEWESGDEWLKCILDPSKNMNVRVKSYAGFEVPGNQSVHRPLGSSKAIVTSDTPGPEQGQIVIFTESHDDRDDLTDLLAAGSPILMQVPGHPDRTVALGDRSSQRIVDTASQLTHEETLSWTVVENP